MTKPTRRQALVTIAAAGVASAQGPKNPSTLTSARYEVLAAAVDLVIPESDTPGAATTGVAALIDEDAINRPWRDTLESALDALLTDGFLDANLFGREAMLTHYMNHAGEERAYFQLLKDLCVDYYYSTEIGLAQELGYQGNTFVVEWVGCTHPEHQG